MLHEERVELKRLVRSGLTSVRLVQRAGGAPSTKVDVAYVVDLPAGFPIKEVETVSG